MIYKPLRWYIFYILFTIIISFWGPIEYTDFNKIIAALYIMLFLVVIFIGYNFGIKTIYRRKTITKRNVENKAKIFLKISIVIMLIIGCWNCINYIAINGFALKNLGQAYVSLYDGYERNVDKSYSILQILIFTTAIFSNSAVILGGYYWEKLSKNWRKLLILGIILYLSVSLLLSGKLKYVGDISIFILSISMISDKVFGIKINKRSLLLIGICFIAIFIFLLKLRYGAIGIDLHNYNSRIHQLMYMNTDWWLFNIVGDEWGFPLAVLLTTYLSGGYYGLSLCLSLPFEWTFGLGHSYALSVIANRYFGLPFLFEEGYVMRMENEFGWPAMSKWHTIFPYFASDITFLGTLILFFLISYIYAITYVEALKYKNPVSLLFFTYLNILFIFVPCNNQLFIGPEGYFSFILILGYWSLFHKKYNILD